MVGTDTDRRQFLTRVAVGAGAVWTAPVVTTIGLSPAAAASGTPQTQTLQRPLAATGWNNAPFVGATPATLMCTTFDAQSGATAQMIGLNSDPNSSNNWQSLDFAMYFVNFGGGMTLNVYESGSFRTGLGAVSVGDEMCIEQSAAGAITYSRNGTVVFTSPTTSTATLFVDSSFWSQNSGFWSTGSSTWSVTGC